MDTLESFKIFSPAYAHNYSLACITECLFSYKVDGDKCTG